MTQYNKKIMTIAKLVETAWLTRYPWPTEIKNDRGQKIIGRELKYNVIPEEYGIEYNTI